MLYYTKKTYIINFQEYHIITRVYKDKIKKEYVKLIYDNYDYCIQAKTIKLITILQ